MFKAVGSVGFPTHVGPSVGWIAVPMGEAGPAPSGRLAQEPGQVGDGFLSELVAVHREFAILGGCVEHAGKIIRDGDAPPARVQIISGHPDAERMPLFEAPDVRPAAQLETSLFQALAEQGCQLPFEFLDFGFSGRRAGARWRHHQPGVVMLAARRRGCVHWS